jgi:hypothetical protein
MTAALMSTLPRVKHVSSRSDATLYGDIDLSARGFIDKTVSW